MNKLLLTALPLACALSVTAQQNTLTTKDYERAESRLSYGTEPFIDHGAVRPEWTADGKFWFRSLTPTGSEFIVVDPAKKTRLPAFDHARRATALSTAAGKQYSASMLPFNSISFTDGGKAVVFRADGQQYKCDLGSYVITKDDSKMENRGGNSAGGRRRGGGLEVTSPDGSKAAYIKDWNLWVKDVKTGKSTQLTTDGIKNYGYATDNAGWKSSDGPVVRWSPDSKKIATFKDDQREVGNMYLVTTNVGHPTLKEWKYPLPGDKVIPMIERVIIDVDNPKVIKLQVPADPHRATLSDDIASSGTFDDVDWNDDASQLAFVSTSRDHKQEKFRIADANTGAVREVFEETVPTQYESGWGAINWRYLAGSNEIIWFSERDNWGHLYLYDAKTGKVKNQITKGDWVVTRMIKVDEKKRMIWFEADGTDEKNPYFTHFFRIGFDGKHLTDLTPAEGNHQVSFSPDENYIVDTYSQPDVPPVAVVRDLNGKQLVEVDKEDVSRLEATGWHAPIPFSAKAHDGKTDIYGLYFAPANADPNKK